MINIDDNNDRTAKMTRSHSHEPVKMIEGNREESHGFYSPDYDYLEIHDKGLECNDTCTGSNYFTVHFWFVRPTNIHCNSP